MKSCQYKLLILFICIVGSQSVLAQVVDTLCVSDPTGDYHVDGWPGSTFEWIVPDGQITRGSGSDSISVTWNSTPGIYPISVVETSANGCIGDTQYAQVLIIDPPNLQISGPKRVCEGDTAKLTASGGIDYVWNTGDTGAVVTINPTTSQTYSVVSNTKCGNDATNYGITVKPKPVFSIEINGKKFICEGEQTQLVATGDATEYFWPSLGWGSRQRVSKNGTYEVTAYLDGCESFDSVTVGECRNLIPYNTFTPDGDGINDKFEIDKIEYYPNAQVEIYNRWGDVIYESTGYSNPWDGTWNGTPLPVGAYYYVVDPKDERAEKISGYINLIRR
jgi:gliding motility-associated-like protein